MSVFWFFCIFLSIFCFLFCLRFCFSVSFFCFVLFFGLFVSFAFCFQFLKGCFGISMALLHTWLAIFSLRTNYQLAQLNLCAVRSFRMLFYFCPPGCVVRIFILMGRILIHILNLSLQTKNNPRIIYFCKIFNSPTGNYPKECYILLDQPREFTATGEFCLLGFLVLNTQT